MSIETDLLKADKEGLLLVGLPRLSEIIVRVLSRKTGHNAAQLISVALEHLADKVLDEQEKEELKKAIKDQF